MIFRRRLWDDIFINEHYDELWIIPQVFHINRGFLQAFRKCPAREVPFVWDPMAIEAVGRTLPHAGEYIPNGNKKRLTIIEPNIDVLKFCLYPILISELAYREIPELISYLHVANSDHMALEETEFAKLMRKLNIVQDRKASFIGRVDTPYFLSNHTDIIVSHQWGLPLNYFYLECAWQGYPIVHNADIIKEIGYYYNDHDIHAASQNLIHAIRCHDESYHEYRKNMRFFISKFLSTNPLLIDQYDKLLFSLFSKK
jgi:hypothetical protein